MTSQQFKKNSHAPKALDGKVRGRFENKEAVKADTLMVTPD
jgi:hypothetical protein